MPFAQVPHGPYEAFQSDSADTAWSKAAHLTVLGLSISQQRGFLEDLDEEESELIGDVPGLERPSLESIVPAISEISNELTRHGYDSSEVRERRVELLEAALAGGSVAALQLIFSSTFHEDPPTSVAAAATMARLIPELPGLTSDALLAGLHNDESSTVRHLAADALAFQDPNHPALLEWAGDEGQLPGPERAHTSITIHGTWARFGSWWRPRSEFFQYLRREVSEDLYSGKDHFRWSGRYEDEARAKGAKDLARWAEVKEVARFRHLFAHSHGGNVALDAAQGDPSIAADLLVLISVPAHSRTGHWERIASRFGRIVSLRSRLDLVILADRSRLRFPSDQVVEILPPGLWFGHGALLKSETWIENELPDEINFEAGIS